MKNVMTSLSFEQAPYGYTLHAEEDKLFVMRKVYDENTGEVVDVEQSYICGTTQSEVKKLMSYLYGIGIEILYPADEYTPDKSTVAVFDADAEFALNETANTITFSTGWLFSCFGLDSEHEVETWMLDADGNAIVTEYQMAPEPDGDEEYKWYAGM